MIMFNYRHNVYECACSSIDICVYVTDGVYSEKYMMMSAMIQIYLRYKFMIVLYLLLDDITVVNIHAVSY